MQHDPTITKLNVKKIQLSIALKPLIIQRFNSRIYKTTPTNQ